MKFLKKLKEYYSKNRKKFLVYELIINIVAFMVLIIAYFISLHNVDLALNAANIGLNLFETKDFGGTMYGVKIINLAYVYNVSMRYLFFLFPLLFVIVFVNFFIIILKLFNVKNGATRNNKFIFKEKK